MGASTGGWNCNSISLPSSSTEMKDISLEGARISEGSAPVWSMEAVMNPLCRRCDRSFFVSIKYRVKSPFTVWAFYSCKFRLRVIRFLRPSFALSFVNVTLYILEWMDGFYAGIVLVVAGFGGWYLKIWGLNVHSFIYSNSYFYRIS